MRYLEFMKPVVLGLDIGGANLKAALSTGQARTLRFPLTFQPELLFGELRGLTDGMSFDRVAVTMTAESCDCFTTKRDGVRCILEAVSTLFDSEKVIVWGVDQRFHSLFESTDLLNFAASNWLALAVFAGRFVPEGPAVMIDVGSTTTDVVALFDGKPIIRGRSDSERLQTGELIYTGVRNTPICALLGWDVTAEFFATTLDAYLVLGVIPESPKDIDTPDGRPATRACAQARLARMLGGDVETTDISSIEQLARQVLDKQISRFRESIDRHDPSATRIISGSGEFLARAACSGENPIISLSEKLGPSVSTAACAYAVSVLAAEEL